MNLAWLALLAGCGKTGDAANSATTTAINGSSAATSTDGGGQKKPAVDAKHPVVLIETSVGNITVKLDAVNSYSTVENFLSYISNGFYDRTLVHQVFKGKGFLAGGFDTNLAEKRPRTAIRNEAHNCIKNRRGTISMVRRPDDIDSATSQFFINISDNPALDHRDRTAEGYGYCVFGEVTEGLEVVDAIGNVQVQDKDDFERIPAQQVVIKSIRCIR